MREHEKKASKPNGFIYITFINTSEICVSQETWGLFLSQLQIKQMPKPLNIQHYKTNESFLSKCHCGTSYFLEDN